MAAICCSSSARARSGESSGRSGSASSSLGATDVSSASVSASALAAFELRESVDGSTATCTELNGQTDEQVLAKFVEISGLKP